MNFSERIQTVRRPVKGKSDGRGNLLANLTYAGTQFAVYGKLMHESQFGEYYCLMRLNVSRITLVMSQKSPLICGSSARRPYVAQYTMQSTTSIVFLLRVNIL